MKEPIHIAIVSHCLSMPGGIERAIVNTANLFHEKGYQVSIVVLDTEKSIFYPLHHEIKVLQYPFHLGIGSRGNMLTRKWALVKQIGQLRKIFHSLAPDVILGTDQSLTCVSWLAGRAQHRRIMAWEHHHALHLKRNRFWNFLQKKIYPKLDQVVCLNREEVDIYRERGCKSLAIPNFIPFLPAQKPRSSSGNIATIGWLSLTKGVDLIPAIAEEVFHKHPHWHWNIIGKGSEQSLLEKTIQEKNLTSFITIHPPVNHSMEPVYANTDLLVMTSRFECFPMVLLEAQAAGIPCLSFNCATGPRYILSDGKNGRLIEPGNTTAMAAAICSLIENEEEREKMGVYAAANALQFLPEEIFPLWQQLLEKG